MLNAGCPEYHLATHRFERLHDLRQVRSSKNLRDRPWYIAAFISWGIACFDYLIQVPANRLGHTQMSVSQLKIMQEVITLSVFAPFAVLYMNESLKWDYLWAGLCLLGAVYFMFRS